MLVVSRNIDFTKNQLLVIRGESLSLFFGEGLISDCNVYTSNKCLFIIHYNILDITNYYFC